MSDKLLYGFEDQEILTATDPEEVVELILDSEFRHISEKTEDMLDRIEFPIRVFEFKQKIVTERSIKIVAESTLETVLERLGDEYGNSEDEYEFSDKIKELSLEFVRDIVAEYNVWQYEETGKVFEYDRNMNFSIINS